MSADRFDPRQAALNYAGRVEAIADRPGFVPGKRDLAQMVGEAANAVTCGLVYVGDQVGRVAEVLDAPRAEREGAKMRADLLRAGVHPEDARRAGNG